MSDKQEVLKIIERLPEDTRLALAAQQDPCLLGRVIPEERRQDLRVVHGARDVRTILDPQPWLMG